MLLWKTPENLDEIVRRKICYKDGKSDEIIFDTGGGTNLVGEECNALTRKDVVDKIEPEDATIVLKFPAGEKKIVSAKRVTLKLPMRLEGGGEETFLFKKALIVGGMGKKLLVSKEQLHKWNTQVVLKDKEEAIVICDGKVLIDSPKEKVIRINTLRRRKYIEMMKKHGYVGAVDFQTLFKNEEGDVAQEDWYDRGNNCV